MASGYRLSNGVDLDDVFEPRTSAAQVGTGFRDAGGTDLTYRYEPLSSGAPAPATGFRILDGRDFSQIFAAKGSVVYALPINGGNFSSNNQSRGTASIKLNIYANGTYDVQDWRGTGLFTVLASGVWLPAGDAAANWAVSIASEHHNDSTIDGGKTGSETTAPGAVPCTADYFGRVFSTANLTTDRASCSGTITASLYRAGVLRSTTRINAFTNVNGN